MEGQLTLERALEDQRTAERKLEISEKKAGESAAAISQLEQSLSKACDDVRLSSDADQRLQDRLDAALAALDDKQSPTAPDAALSSEIEGLRSQLKDTTNHASEQYKDGYLAAIAQSPLSIKGKKPPPKRTTKKMRVTLGGLRRSMAADEATINRQHGEISKLKSGKELQELKSKLEQAKKQLKDASKTPIHRN